MLITVVSVDSGWLEMLHAVCLALLINLGWACVLYCFYFILFLTPNFNFAVWKEAHAVFFQAALHTTDAV